MHRRAERGAFDDAILILCPGNPFLAAIKNARQNLQCHAESWLDNHQSAVIFASPTWLQNATLQNGDVDNSAALGQFRRMLGWRLYRHERKFEKLGTI